jgi:hypothetical protein
MENWQAGPGVFKLKIAYHLGLVEVIFFIKYVLLSSGTSIGERELRLLLFGYSELDVKFRAG